MILNSVKLSDHLNRVVTKILMCVLIVSIHSNAIAQEFTDSQKSKMKRITSLVDRAGKLFKSKEYEDSGNRIRSAQKVLLALAESSDSNLVLQLKTDHQRIVKAKKLLEGKGEIFDDMPDFDSLWSIADKGGAKSESNGSDTKDESSASTDSVEGSSSKKVDKISFKKQVAPIIVEHCGQCHVDESRGKYSAANYVALKKGTRKGTAIKPKDASNSRMINLIENGAMPPKGEVPDDQLKILKDWINQGAKFDGTKKEEKSLIKDFASDSSMQGKQ